MKPWLDQAGKFTVEHIGGIPHFNTPVALGRPRTGVLHTTEGNWASGMAVFKKHFAPHFMLGLDDAEGKVRIAQLVQIGTIGAALKMHNDMAIVQIELVGFSDTKLWIPDTEVAEALASLMAACADEYGIPLTRPWKDGDFGKAGNNPHRASGKFGTVAGWYGHGDCPLPDTHWDPGNLKWGELFKIAQGMGSGGSGPLVAEAGPQAMAREEAELA